jgi:hypothetical protein
MTGIHIEVTRETLGGLHRLFWRFWLDDGHNTLKLVLDEYQIQERKTRRQKYEVIERWSRLYKRQSNLNRRYMYLPLEVLEEAKAKLVRLIEFEKERPWLK